MTAQLETPTKLRTYKNYIAGEWMWPDQDETYRRISPVTGQPIVEIPWSQTIDTDRAIQAARQTFDQGDWPKADAKTRHRILQQTAQLLQQKMPELAQVICAEMGRPMAMAMYEVQRTIEIFEYFAGVVLNLQGESFTQLTPHAMGLTTHEPIGVVGIITPWNFPLILVAWKVAPAIATGCTMVIKPSELAPSCTFMLAELIAAAGAPAGVVNVITGAGDVVGERLVESPLVDKIAFTGSTAIGQRIMAKAAPTLKRLSLELGGKSPNIVFPDADLAAAIQGAFMGIYMNSGQVCQAGSRLLLHESIKDAFVEQLLAATRTIQLGDPTNPTTLMGPIVSPQQLHRVQQYIDRGIAEGAKLLAGGSDRAIVPGLEQGLFLQPTIFDGVERGMKIAQEEIFGPVLSILTFKNEAEALAIANDSMYGLAAAVWTKNLDTALRMAKGIRAGTVWINTYHSSGLEPAMPFGGYKQSGIGREMGVKCLESYCETKSIHIALPTI